MKTVLDVCISFPLKENEDCEGGLKELYKFCGTIEDIEKCFDVEFSCGDGKYLSEIEDDEAELEKYDGNVCTLTPPIERRDGKELKANVPHNFVVKYSEQDEQMVFFLNGKETFRKVPSETNIWYSFSRTDC